MQDFVTEEYKKESDYIIDYFVSKITGIKDKKLLDNQMSVDTVTYEDEEYDLYRHKTETETGFHLIPIKDRFQEGSYQHMIVFDASYDGINLSILDRNSLYNEFTNYSFIREEESIYSIYEYFIASNNVKISDFNDFTPDVLRNYHKRVQKEIRNISMIRRYNDKTLTHYITDIPKIGKFKYLQMCNEFYSGSKYQNPTSNETPLIKIHEGNLGKDTKQLVKKHLH